MSKYLVPYNSFHDLLEADSLDHLVARAQRLVETLGLDKFVFGGYSALAEPGSDPLILGSYPLAWQERYRQLQFQSIDPCVRHFRSSLYPVVWTRRFFADPAALGMLEEARCHGIFSGITCPAPLSSLGQFCMSATNGDNIETSSIHMAERVPEIHLLSSFFLEAFRGMRHEAQAAVELTKRECQCLSLAANGCRDGDISEKLRISVRTVVFHLNNARRKLRASNRSQMIARAIVLGTVTP